jgi:regulator of nucleoside diphosphate kinase
MTLPPVFVLDEDWERLADIVCAAPRSTPGLSLLWQELKRAEVLRGGDAPDDLIRMGSVIDYTEAGAAAPRTGQLVYPGGVGLRRGGIAVTAPVGAALIGLRPGDEFRWNAADQTPRALRIERVAAGGPAIDRGREQDRRILREMLLEFFGND